MITQNTHSLLKVQGQGNKKLIIGIDMGSFWEMIVSDPDQHRFSRFRFKGSGKEYRCHQKIGEFIAMGYDVYITYEAGRYGFTPARTLSKLGAHVRVIPVNKIEVVCSGKRVKTDKIDARFLAELPWNDSKKVPQVYIPSIAEECDRGCIREKKRIKNEIRRNNNRILSILERWPIFTNKKTHRTSEQWRSDLGYWEKEGYIDLHLPMSEYLQIKNMVDAIALLETQACDWEKLISKRCDEQRDECRNASTQCVLDILQSYQGIGSTIAITFSWLIGDFRRFKNAKHFTSFFGLTPTPWISCQMKRDQGISKAGNKELRRMAIQLGWLWVKWQPDSALTRKWKERLDQGKRARRIAIVALTRQLLEALYRNVVHGTEIEDAKINKPIPVNY